MVGSTTTATYTFGNALIRKDGETPMFDGLGSERTVTNSSQTVAGTITFEGFGATIATTGSSSNPYKFAATSGYRDDGDAGLVHVGARYYDAQVGRFITRDTYLNQKPYLYCDHDPVNAVDPSGHDVDINVDQRDHPNRPHPKPWNPPPWVKGGVMGLITGSLVIVGIAALPIEVPAVITGVIAGTLGGIAQYGYGTKDPGDITYGGIGEAAGGGAIIGTGGGITGTKPIGATKLILDKVLGR